MKSKLLWVIVAVPLLGAVGYALYWYFRAPYLPPPSGAEEIAAVRKRGAKTADVAVMPTRSFDSSYRVRLAIGGLGSKNEEHNRQIGDLLTAELSSAKALELLERQSVDKILGELNLNISGLVRAKDAVRVGKLLRADWFLLGTVAPAGTSNIIVARVVDARTGALVDATICADRENPSAVAADL